MGLFSTCRRLVRGRIPGQAVIQITDRCNASCVQCGMRRANDFPRHSLDQDTVERILDAVARLGMQAVSFTGGEPLLHAGRLMTMIRHAKKRGIRYIRTGTNGFIFQGHDAPGFPDRMRRMADDLLESGIRNFWISLDSSDPTIHEANRGLPGVVAGMAKALPLFHERGLYPSVNLGINRFCGGRIPALTTTFEPQTFKAGFVEAFSRFFSRAEELGFTIANCCYPMTQDEGAVYQASSQDEFICFSTPEKEAMLEALMEVIPTFRHRLRLFTPLSSLDALLTQVRGNEAQTFPCRGGLDFFFVDATKGHAYPCGYRAEDDLGPLWTMDALPEAEATCRRCDWECFRDPSELFGPLTSLVSAPRNMVRKFRARPDFLRLWLDDLRYYLACDLFDGRKPMRPRQLARFAPRAGETRFDMPPGEESIRPA